jgi:hypothetical protein
MPGDFREHFDLRKLDEKQLGMIEFVLQSPAYVEAFKPYIEGIIRGMDALWRDRSELRKQQYPDDFLAGGVTFAEGLLKFFDLILSESSMERIHASMEGMTSDQLYDAKHERGQIKPVVGVDQQALPGAADPDEF